MRICTERKKGKVEKSQRKKEEFKEKSNNSKQMKLFFQIFIIQMVCLWKLTFDSFRNIFRRAFERLLVSFYLFLQPPSLSFTRSLSKKSK